MKQAPEAGVFFRLARDKILQGGTPSIPKLGEGVDRGRLEHHSEDRA